VRQAGYLQELVYLFVFNIIAPPLWGKKFLITNP